jgi:hypothetical protein
MILPGGAMISMPMIAEGITGAPDKPLAKWSDLATKVIRRSNASGMKNQSAKDK